jgi:hypothetical protein
MLGVNPYFDALAEQPAVHRVDIAMHVNHAALGHRHRQSLAAFQTALGQRPQQRPLLGQAFLPARVAPPRYLTQEGQVIRAADKFPTATQQERLRHRSFEVPMRRLGVAVLVTRRRIRLFHHQSVMGHQLLITVREFTLVR